MTHFKKIIAITLASVISAYAMAGTAPNAIAPEVVNPAKELVESGFAGKASKFAEALKLTDDQKMAIETALIGVRASLPAKDSVSLDAFIDAQVAAREAAKAAIEAALTPEQKALLLALQTQAQGPDASWNLASVDTKPPAVKPPEATKPPAVKPPEATKPPAVKPPEATKPPAVKPPEATKPSKANPPEGTKPSAVKPPVTGKPPTTPLV